MSEDKIKMVIVVRHDLQMRMGKAAAQVAHGSMSFLIDKLNRGEPFTEVEQIWMNGAFTKIVARVDSEEELLGIAVAASEAGVENTVIRDKGLTEFSGESTFTVCALGPDFSSKIDPITGGLKLL